MKFGSLLLMFTGIFLFGVIYQHNLIIKNTYNLQTLTREEKKLLHYKNTLIHQYCTQRNNTFIAEWASKRGMGPLEPQKITCIEHQEPFLTFIRTTSNQGDVHGS